MCSNSYRPEDGAIVYNYKRQTKTIINRCLGQRHDGSFSGGLIISARGRGRAQISAASHDHKTSQYNNMDDGTDNRPLFQEIAGRDTIVNLTVGGLTSVFVLLTVISSFVFPTPPPTSLNVFFVLCIIMICSSVLVLIFWYRQGDLDPKFLGLIYYSIGSIFLLCLCANLYFHDVGK